LGTRKTVCGLQGPFIQEKTSGSNYTEVLLIGIELLLLSRIDSWEGILRNGAFLSLHGHVAYEPAA